MTVPAELAAAGTGVCGKAVPSATHLRLVHVPDGAGPVVAGTALVEGEADAEATADGSTEPDATADGLGEPAADGEICEADGEAAATEQPATSPASARAAPTVLISPKVGRNCVVVPIGFPCMLWSACCHKGNARCRAARRVLMRALRVSSTSDRSAHSPLSAAQIPPLWMAHNTPLPANWGRSEVDRHGVPSPRRRR